MGNDVTIKDPLDFTSTARRGRELNSDLPSNRFFLPKSRIHTLTGHVKSISAIKYLPKQLTGY